MRADRRLLLAALVGLLALSLAACNYPGMQGTPKVRYITWTPKPTDTTLPTDTPAPTLTWTPEPSATFTQSPEQATAEADAAAAAAATQAAQAAAAAPTQPPAAQATIPPDQAIRVYYINKDKTGTAGCNEALYYVLTKQAKSQNKAADIRFALNLILAYHQPQFGTLYNGAYASNLTVSNVEVSDDGRAIVSLSGEYVATDDRCDGPRMRDQLRQTIKDLGPFSYIQILINGTPIADAISRK